MYNLFHPFIYDAVVVYPLDAVPNFHVACDVFYWHFSVVSQHEAPLGYARRLDVYISTVLERLERPAFAG